MGKTVLFMGVAIIVLLIIISLQFPQIQSARAEVAEAQEYSATVKELLRAIDVRCAARSDDFTAMQACITPVLRKDDFSTDTFRPFDERRNASGVFVIVNEGSKTYNGSAFVLAKNGADVKTGCHITSEILADYTCRFDLVEPCVEGDVFTVTYEETRLVTKTC